MEREFIFKDGKFFEVKEKEEIDKRGYGGNFGGNGMDK